jgi:urease accessory protein
MRCVHAIAADMQEGGGKAPLRITRGASGLEAIVGISPAQTHDPLPKFTLGASMPEPGAPPDAACPDPAALYRLMAWLSPAYPVGAFAFSSGLEWAVEAGDIADAESLRRWIAVITTGGGGFCDAVFFAHAHQATATGDDDALAQVADLAAAFAPTRERHLETTVQGAAFMTATRAAWPCAALDRLASVCDGPVYPVAVAAAAAGHGVAVAPALAAYLQAIAANLISAGIRLVPLGQTDGQRVLAALEPVIAATTRQALATPLDAVGGAAFRADLASARHETQYTRLFRS